jgi:hypothetical protein
MIRSLIISNGVDPLIYHNLSGQALWGNTYADLLPASKH